jgi:putative membrane protein
VTERDPRIYFAAERTLLAWVRTGIAVVGLGFVVARLHPPRGPQPFASVLGGVLALIGGALTAAATVEFRGYSRRLAPEQLPEPRLGVSLAMLMGITVAIAGALLGGQLLLPQ